MVWNVLMILTFVLSGFTHLRFFRQLRDEQLKTKGAVQTYPLHALSAIVSFLLAVLLVGKVIFEISTGTR
jgi:hypothetical protein